MKTLSNILIGVMTIVIVTSCTTTKKLNHYKNAFNEINGQYNTTKNELVQTKNDLKLKETQLSDCNQQINHLKKQIEFLEKNNNSVIDRLQDLSVLSVEQSQNIKKSLESIQIKDLYINNLQKSIALKDSLNLRLVMNLKSALGDINDGDVTIDVEKGVIYINIADKILFKSGSYFVNEDGRRILSKVAKVLNSQSNLEFMIEGNTDSVPYQNGLLLDNWDLSTKRASSVCRILTNDYDVNPKKITIAGRGEFVPVDTNDTSEGRGKNRRTRIIILPQLDEFFKLLEKK